MDIKALHELKDLLFTFTDEMRELSLRMLVIKQMLNEEELKPKERKQLQKEFDKLFKEFKIIFKAHNQEQIVFLNWYLGKKNESDEN